MDKVLLLTALFLSLEATAQPAPVVQTEAGKVSGVYAGAIYFDLNSRPEELAEGRYLELLHRRMLRE
jgi:hypothetical protein